MGQNISGFSCREPKSEPQDETFFIFFQHQACGISSCSTRPVSSLAESIDRARMNNHHSQSQQSSEGKHDDDAALTDFLASLMEYTPTVSKSCFFAASFLLFSRQNRRLSISRTTIDTFCFVSIFLCRVSRRC